MTKRHIAIGCALGCLAISAVRAEITDTSLTIGESSTVVRELRRISVQPGENEWLFDDIPPEADLSTLVIRTRRTPVEMISWERLPVRSAEPGVVDGELRVRLDGQPLASAQWEEGSVVRCLVRVPVGGVQVFELTYQVTGLTWAVHYEVLVRGDPDGPREAVPLDLTGVLSIDNRTSRSFANASVRLIGADPRMPRVPRRRPGILMLADHPLADLWRELPIAQPPERSYSMPRRVELPAHTLTTTPFISATRVSAGRLFVMDAESVPLSMTGSLEALPQFLVVQNTAENGLGRALPPGPVSLYQGATRRSILQEGFLPHTGMGQDIRVDLGPSPLVSGSRRSVGRRTEPGGDVSELFQLVVDNRRASGVSVEIVERPRMGSGWTLERVSEAHELERHRLILRPRLEAGEVRRIEYRIRQPETSS